MKRNLTSIYRGFECGSDPGDSEEEVLQEFYPVVYSGVNLGEKGPLAAKLVFEGNMTTGGFKVFDESEDLFKIEWQNTLQLEFIDQECIVKLL